MHKRLLSVPRRYLVESPLTIRKGDLTMGFTEYNYALYVGYVLLLIFIGLITAAIVTKDDSLGAFSTGWVFLPAVAFFCLYFEYGDRSVFMGHLSFLLGCSITLIPIIIKRILCRAKVVNYEY